MKERNARGSIVRDEGKGVTKKRNMIGCVWVTEDWGRRVQSK